MKIKILLFFIAVAIFSSCKEDDENLNEKGNASFSLTELVEVENATIPLAVNIGIDNFNHNGGTVDVSITGATYGSDYETSAGSNSFTLDIAPQSLITVFSIQPVDDEVIEEDKILTVTLSNPTGSIDLGESTTLTFTILDNDDPLIAMVGFENETDQIEENSSNPLTINIPFNQATTDGGTISVSSSGDAAFGTDYTIDGQTSDSFVISVPAGATSTSFNIQTIDNTDFEADKTVVFTINEVSGGLSVGALTETTVTIINDDSPPNPVIDFSATNTLTYNEDVGTFALNFDITGTTTSDATVEITFSGSADASDFNINGSNDNPYSFIIPSGSNSGTLSITIVDDSDIETDETITLDISSVTGGLDAGLNIQSQTITITDNDEFGYLETFESNDGSSNYLSDVLGFEAIVLNQTIDANKVLELITNSGSFSDPVDVNGTSDNGLNIFYNTGNDPVLNGEVDNVLITQLIQGSGSMDISIDAAYAFKNQNVIDVTFYWSQTYDGSGIFNESDWTVMGTESVTNMDSEGFGNNSYKREEFTVAPSSNFYIAIRLSGTVDDDNYRFRWRFDNINVNSQ